LRADERGFAEGVEEAVEEDAAQDFGNGEDKLAVGGFRSW
jgi:hypothetical protein